MTEAASSDEVRRAAAVDDAEMDDAEVDDAELDAARQTEAHRGGLEHC